MSEKEIKDFLDKVDIGIREAQHNMLVEKALRNESVFISDGNGGVLCVSAKQLLADEKTRSND